MRYVLFIFLATLFSYSFASKTKGYYILDDYTINKAQLSTEVTDELGTGSSTASVALFSLDDLSTIEIVDTIEVSGDYNISTLKNDNSLLFKLRDNLIFNRPTRGPEFTYKNFDSIGTDGANVTNVLYSATDNLFNTWQYEGYFGNPTLHSSDYRSSGYSAHVGVGRLLSKVATNTDATYNVTFYALFSSTNTDYFTFKVFAEHARTNEILRLKFSNNTTNSNYIQIAFNGGTYNGYYTPGWQKFEVIMHQNTKTADLYMNNTARFAGSSYYTAVTSSSVATLGFYGDNSSYGFIDDVIFGYSTHNNNKVTLGYETDYYGTTQDMLSFEENKVTVEAPELYGSSANFGSITGATIEVTNDIYTIPWTDYSATSTITGFSSFILKKIYYKKIGKTVFVEFDIRGFSNASSITFTVPYTSFTPDIGTFANGAGFDNGSPQSLPTLIHMTANSNTVNVYRDGSFTSWTASGEKRCQGQFFYEVQ